MCVCVCVCVCGGGGGGGGGERRGKRGEVGEQEIRGITWTEERMGKMNSQALRTATGRVKVTIFSSVSTHCELGEASRVQKNPEQSMMPLTCILS